MAGNGSSSAPYSNGGYSYRANDQNTLGDDPYDQRGKGSFEGPRTAGFLGHAKEGPALDGISYAYASKQNNSIRSAGDAVTSFFLGKIADRFGKKFIPVVGFVAQGLVFGFLIYISNWGMI